MIRRLILTLAYIWSVVVSWFIRLDHLFRRMATPPTSDRGVCPFCGSTLGAPERRPPRDTRQPGNGKIKRLPAEILTWRVCAGCTRYQVGELVR